MHATALSIPRSRMPRMLLHSDVLRLRMMQNRTGLDFFGTLRDGREEDSGGYLGRCCQDSDGFGFREGDDGLETLKEGSMFTEILRGHGDGSC